MYIILLVQNFSDHNFGFFNWKWGPVADDCLSMNKILTLAPKGLKKFWFFQAVSFLNYCEGALKMVVVKYKYIYKISNSYTYLSLCMSSSILFPLCLSCSSLLCRVSLFLCRLVAALSTFSALTSAAEILRRNVM